MWSVFGKLNFKSFFVDKSFSASHVAIVASVSLVVPPFLESFLTPGGRHKIRKEDLKAFIKARMQHLPRAESSPKNRILIVDDDPSVQKLFSKMLSHNGYRIALASDGFEAGIKTVQFKPDLMILDLVMSGMDGFEVCKHIKENPNTSHIKVLAYTGYDTKA